MHRSLIFRLADQHAAVACHDPHPDVAVLQPRGEIDLLSAPEIIELVARKTRRFAHVVLDLKLVSFCDARGVAALLAGDRIACEGDSTVLLADLTSPVRRVLRVCRVEHQLAIVHGPASEAGHRAESCRADLGPCPAHERLSAAPLARVVVPAPSPSQRLAVTPERREQRPEKKTPRRGDGTETLPGSAQSYPATAELTVPENGTGRD